MNDRGSSDCVFHLKQLLFPLWEPNLTFENQTKDSGYSTLVPLWESNLTFENQTNDLSYSIHSFVQRALRFLFNPVFFIDQQFSGCRSRIEHKL
jgi:hypothetical protein